MTESRSEFLARVAEAHYQWEGQELPTATFTPHPGEEDYNLHDLDVDGSPQAQEALVTAVGPADYVDDGSVPDTDSPSAVPDQGGGN